MAELNFTLDQLDLTGINRTFNLMVVEHTFLTTHGTFPRRDLRSHNSLDNFLKVRLISCHSAIKLKINNKNFENYVNKWKPNDLFLNSQWIKEEYNEELKIFLRRYGIPQEQY